MKKLFLMLSFVTATVFGSDSEVNQVLNYDKSEFKNGFFGNTGFLVVKQFESNDSHEKPNISIKKHKDVIQKDVSPSKALNSMDKDCSSRFHWGFHPIIERPRKDFFKNLSYQFKLTEHNTFYSIEEDSYHVSWHVAEKAQGPFPVIIEHRHKGSCVNPESL